MNLQEELSLPFPLRPYQEEGVEFLTSNNSEYSFAKCGWLTITSEFL